MEDWRTLYQQKLTTAEEAVKHIKSGDRVVVTHATGEPILLTDAMVANAEQYENVEVVHMVAMGKAEYCLPENSKHFRHNSLFLGGSTRKAIEEGRGDFTPVFFSEIPELFRTTLHPNVVLLHLSTPDEHGYCSFGVSCDYTKPAAECDLDPRDGVDVGGPNHRELPLAHRLEVGAGDDMHRRLRGGRHRQREQEGCQKVEKSFHFREYV